MTQARASPRALAKANSKVREHVEPLTRRTRITRTNQGGAPALHQGGRPQIPLVGSKMHCPQPVSRRRLMLRGNKEPRVAMKMGTSWVPGNASV